MNIKKEELNQSLEKKPIDKQRKRVVNKINPGTITKLVREAYANDPQGILKISPELFRIFEEESSRKKIDRRYFEHYLTERERADFSSQIISITKQAEIKHEDAIKVLELLAALGIEEEAFRTAFLKASQILELDINAEKDYIRTIRRGEVANRVEILRGILLGLDWSGALMEVALFGKDIKIRKDAESMIGCLSLDGYGSGPKEDRKIQLNSKVAVMDISAFFSIIDREAPNHKMMSLEFLRLINDRVMIVCPKEILRSLIFQVSALVGFKVKDVYNHAKGCLVIYSVSSSKQAILKHPSNDENRRLDGSSVHAILLSKEIGAPLFASDHNVIAASESENLEILNDVMI